MQISVEFVAVLVLQYPNISLTISPFYCFVEDYIPERIELYKFD